MFITRIYSYDGGSNTIGLGWRVVLAFNELTRQRRVAVRQGKKVVKEQVSGSIPIVSPYNLRVSTIGLEEAESGRLDLDIDSRLKLRDIITSRWKLARHLPIQVRKVLRRAVKPNITRKDYIMSKNDEELDDVLNEDVPVPAARRAKKSASSEKKPAAVKKAKTSTETAPVEKTRKRRTAEVVPVTDTKGSRRSRKVASEKVEVKSEPKPKKNSGATGKVASKSTGTGYRGHRNGSLVEKAHKLFDDKLFPRYENGKMNRPAMAEHLENKIGISGTTARTWVYKWTRTCEAEAGASAKLAAKQAKREARASA